VACLDIDKCIFLAPRHPKAIETTWHIPSLFSIWGIETERVPYLDGLGVYEEAVNPPLASVTSPNEIRAYEWPNAGDWDYSHLKSECEEWRDYPIVGASYEPFYLYCRLRGMSLALQDLIENPELVEVAMEIIFDIHADVVSRVIDVAGESVDFIYVAEDLGTQNSLLMSPSCFRRSIKLWLHRMIELVHSLGKWAFHHDDGAIRPLLPDLVEIGIDVLNPIQWRCKGMDRESLARDFGAHVVFHGAVDNQYVLPFGSPADVAEQVKENLRIFGDGKGYIVAPCHNLQVNTPTENVLALYAAVHAA
jgi:uroporphyrinogen decarboxylase